MTGVIHYLFPGLRNEDIKKFTLLGITAFFIIGVYWLLRLLKQVIFLKVAFPESLGWAEQQGALFQPIAKFWSPFVVLAVVLIYSKLVDIVKKHQLFYIFCAFYGTLFALLGGALLVKDWYGTAALGKHVLAAVGWISYFSVESFGSLVIALFWSFTNSITDSETAKSGFPLILSFAQIGAIGGSTILLFSESIGAMWPLVLLASFFMFMVIAMIVYFMRVMPAEQLVGNKAAAASEKKKDGFFEGFTSGLVLLFTRPYLMGVLVISLFYEIAMQIIEYQMHRQALVCPAYASETALCWFEGMFGVGVNTLSFLMALLGTASIIKYLGLRLSLLVYPIVFALTLLTLFIYFMVGSPTTVQLLWALFATMMIIKGMSYAFNNPVKEMMYIPTSKDAKFKSKSWVDMFGGRFAKATGARVNNFFKHDLNTLMFYGSLISFGLIGIWIIAALYVGKKNQKLIQTGTIVE
jgi:AAA family ATP:ADP antiporter